MKFFKLTALAVAFISIAIACNHENNSAPEKIAESDKQSFHKEEAPQSVSSDSTSAPQEPKQKTNQSTKENWNKKIIKNATVNLEVKNYKNFNDLTREKIKKYGGYIAQEQQNQGDYKIEDVLTIKVPVDQFDNLLSELTTGEEKIIEKKITSEDVTNEVVDTKSRMEAKKQVRLRYLDLLKQAKNMEEILNVQNEINSIQEDIEAASGRIDYLSHSAAYSTINLTYFHILDATAKNPDEISFGSKVWQSFKKGWNWVGDLAIGLISIWPLFFFAFGCWLLYKRFRASKVQKTNS